MPPVRRSTAHEDHEMITRVVLAKLSPTMEEGAIVSWSKAEGDTVKVGDVLAEIETDKANMEMEALGAGILRKVLVPAGGKAPVGSLIAIIADAGDDITALLTEAGPATAQAPAAPPPAASGGFVVPTAPSAAATVAGPEAVANAVTAAPEGRIKASPLARAIAARESIALHTVAGSGPGGRIVRRDLAPDASGTAPVTRQAVPPPSPQAASTPARLAAAGTTVPHTNMRRTIARRLSESLFTAPHFYVSMDVDMDAAVALREQITALEGIKLSFNDLVVKACAKALTRFPMVNSSWGPDAITTHGEVHIGVAVALPDGLITPVLRYADRKPVVDVSREIRDLATRAKEKKLKPEEYQGSTFTVSNLGMFDVAEFTAIINPPESAILAVGAVQKVPVVAGSEIRIGHRMRLTMSSDHRVIDGALAAQFLGEVRRLLETPIGVLV